MEKYIYVHDDLFIGDISSVDSIDSVEMEVTKNYFYPTLTPTHAPTTSSDEDQESTRTVKLVVVVRLVAWMVLPRNLCC
jgi:hypothetical protein